MTAEGPAYDGSEVQTGPDRLHHARVGTSRPSFCYLKPYKIAPETLSNSLRLFDRWTVSTRHLLWL